MHGTSQGTPVPLESFGGLATIADSNSLPEGASPRTYDTDFDIGSVFTRDGLTNAYTYAGSSIGPNSASSATAPAPWVNPTAILANDASYASVVVDTGQFISVTEFGFSISGTASITGFKVALSGYSNVPDTVVTMNLLKNGVPIAMARGAFIGTSPGTIQMGSLTDMWGATWLPSDVNSTSFGLRFQVTSHFTLGTAFFDYVTMTVGVTTGAANFNWIGTFTDQDGTVRNLSQDANGDLWVENVTTNPGELNLALSGITPGSFVSGVSGQGVEFLAFNNLLTGSDVPRQYTSQWIDKITQVGPGASPVFTTSSATGTTSYNISSITQPVAKSWGYSYFLQSAGPGSNTPGNTVTIYYSDSTVSGADQDLVTAFNSGNAVYLYTSFTGGPLTQGPYTALMTSVGLGKPPGQPRKFYYFTYQLPTSVYTYYQGSGHPSYTAHYQRSLATLTTVDPVPSLAVGDSVIVTGNSVAAWNTTWPISQTLNSGAMAITQTELSSAGTGTYSYTVISGANPVAGQLVTVTGTLNGNGQLNVTNVAIATVSGGAAGTFTVDLLPAGTTYPAQAEEGQAVTAGTLFAFDPGIPVVGSGTSPIYGNGTGGSLTISGGQVIGSGTRQGTVFFITRNGYWTAPAPPVTFTTPDNTTTITAANIPIGPANVIGRGISFTEAGQNSVPGGNFFVIPTPETYVALGKTYTATSTIIWDNTTTQASFSFTDNVLLNAEAIDVQGWNLFNLIEIGNPGWIVQYDSRNFYGLCQNKVQNFNNLSFDGGFLDSANPLPLGWSSSDQYGQLLISPVFGNSYYIKNTSGSSPDRIGEIVQGAFQDAYQQPILQPNTAYSIRVTARVPSGPAGGNLVVTLESAGVIKGSTVISTSSGQLTTTFQTITVPFMGALATIPGDLTLHVYGANFAVNTDVEIDRIEIFPTEIPVLTTTVFGSYAAEPEAVDAVTGVVKFTSENQQPVNGAVVMYDTFYGLKDSSMYSLRSSPNLEPAQWDEPEVAQRAGTCGINAYDFGEQWIVTACRNGLYLYEGGQPGRIMPEIFQIWNAIHWSAKQSIWVKNDVTNSRLFIGIPLPAPNFWLPNAPVNTNPTTPNVILVCNYLGVTSGEGIKAESAVHVTMFGTLEAGDMRRKWSLWQIPSPYAAFCPTATDQAFYICNGNANSKVYKLDPDATTDDGVAINSLYTTYGFVNLSKAAQFPMLGMFRKRWGYMTATLTNLATTAVRFLGDKLLGPTDSATGYNAWTVPGGIPPLTDGSGRDRESTANFVATRTFLEFSGTDFDLSNVTLYGKKDTYNAITGKK